MALFRTSIALVGIADHTATHGIIPAVLSTLGLGDDVIKSRRFLRKFFAAVLALKLIALKYIMS